MHTAKTSLHPRWAGRRLALTAVLVLLGLFAYVDGGAQAAYPESATVSFTCAGDVRQLSATLTYPAGTVTTGPVQFWFTYDQTMTAGEPLRGNGFGLGATVTLRATNVQPCGVIVQANVPVKGKDVAITLAVESGIPSPATNTATTKNGAGVMVCLTLVQCRS